MTLNWSYLNGCGGWLRDIDYVDVQRDGIRDVTRDLDTKAEQGTSHSWLHVLQGTWLPEVLLKDKGEKKPNSTDQILIKNKQTLYFESLARPLITAK